MVIHNTIDVAGSDDGKVGNLHFLQEQFHSSMIVSNNKTNKNIKKHKHIILDPFVNLICKSGKTKKKESNRGRKSKESKESKDSQGSKGKETRKNNSFSGGKSKSKKFSKTRKVSPRPYVNVIVDSGATRHCCNNLDIMSNIRNTNVNIMVGNGNIIHATKMGDIGCIKDVLYLPEIKHFLFSISYMLNSCPECRVEFFNGGFQLKVGRKIIGRGVLAESNLYVLRVQLPKKYRQNHLNSPDKSLFIDLDKSNISTKELKELQDSLPIQFEYI